MWCLNHCGWVLEYLKCELWLDAIQEKLQNKTNKQSLENLCIHNLSCLQNFMGECVLWMSQLWPGTMLGATNTSLETRYDGSQTSSGPKVRASQRFQPAALLLCIGQDSPLNRSSDHCSWPCPKVGRLHLQRTVPNASLKSISLKVTQNQQLPQSSFSCIWFNDFFLIKLQSW